MKLPNFNVDTIGAFLQSALTRLENLEAVVATLPGVGVYGQEALGVTAAAGKAVGDLQSLGDDVGLGGGTTPPGATPVSPQPVPPRTTPVPPTTPQKTPGQTDPLPPTGNAAVIAALAARQAQNG